MQTEIEELGELIKDGPRRARRLSVRRRQGSGYRQAHSLGREPQADHVSQSRPGAASP